MLTPERWTLCPYICLNQIHFHLTLCSVINPCYSNQAFTEISTKDVGFFISLFSPQFLKINSVYIQCDLPMGCVDTDSCICLLHWQMLRPSLSILELYSRYESWFCFWGIFVHLLASLCKTWWCTVTCSSVWWLQIWSSAVQWRLKLIPFSCILFSASRVSLGLYKGGFCSSQFSTMATKFLVLWRQRFNFVQVSVSLMPAVPVLSAGEPMSGTLLFHSPFWSCAHSSFFLSNSNHLMILYQQLQWAPSSCFKCLRSILTI